MDASGSSHLLAEAKPQACCPVCSAVTPESETGGLCSRCLLELALTDGGDSAWSDSAPADFPRIANYLLVDHIGEGGCGDVYLAEQVRPLWREVAVKVIKPGMDSRAVLARFEGERQALALMEHPCIAGIFDAGTTEDGRPYFAMEYIAGSAITRWCDEARADFRGRLQLFVRVCHAIQHAHHKGVIHRDIKPSNVLVTMREREPSPKVIDFGIAKATGGQELGDTFARTMLGTVPGTPPYMSPEQAGLDLAGVDTRSDVYQLGVLLYELLTGTIPFLPTGETTGALDELRRRIREEEPELPSLRVQRLPASFDAREMATRRGTTPHVWRRQLAGDLDAVLLKTLEKDPARRYASALDLARDIERYLSGEPVQARRPGFFENVSRFTRRHRVAVLTGVAFLFVLLAASIVSTVAAIRARKAEQLALVEEAKSRRTADFFQQILQGADPIVARGADTTLLRALLDASAARIETETRGAPEVELALRRTIGWSYHRIGRPEEAQKNLRRAVELQRQVPGHEREMAVTLNWLAYATRVTDLAAAEAPAREAAALYEKITAPGAKTPQAELVQAANALPALAKILMAQGKLGEAMGILSRWLEIQRRICGEQSLPVANTYDAMGQCAMKHFEFPGRVPLAWICLNASLRIRSELLGPDDLDLNTSVGRLGEFYWQIGRLDAAEPCLTRQLTTARRLLAKDHPALLDLTARVASFEVERGDLGKATEILREGGALQANSSAKSITRYKETVGILAEALESAGDSAKAGEVRSFVAK